MAGGHMPGPALERLRPSLSIDEILSRRIGPVLAGLRDRVQATAACFLWDGHHLCCLDKALHQDGLVMQELGAVSRNLDGGPWGWAVAHLLGRPLPRTGDAALRRARRQAATDLKSCGWCVDAVHGAPHWLRLAAPVCDGAGRPVACLALGALPGRFDSAARDAAGTALAEAAMQLSAELVR